MSSTSDLAEIPAVLEAIRAGRLVVVVDDEDRENEGDLFIPAQFATPEAINFMATHGRGLICLALTPDRARNLGLRLMVEENAGTDQTAFTITIDAAHGIATGISARDRAHTIAVCLDPASRPEDLVRPGHIFPLIARPGGVLQRAGHTEAAVDLARLAGLPPAGVVCEVLKADGEVARLPDLIPFAAMHGLLITSVAKVGAHLKGLPEPSALAATSR